MEKELNLNEVSNNEESSYVLESNCDYIPENTVSINKEVLFGCNYNLECFQTGINKVSEICGMITALVNVGITPSNALSYISNENMFKDSLEHEKDIASIQSKTNIECAKYDNVSMQKNII